MTPRTTFAALALSLAAPTLALAQVEMDLTRDEERMSSLSIVGFDPDTGDLGVCMASKFFAVGPVAAFVRAGVGAIAIMGAGPFREGERLLDWMEDEGLGPAEVLQRLRSEYAERGELIGQLNIVDASGESLSTTGPGSSLWKGHRFGRNYATAGNILAGPQVVDAFADTFEASEGSGLPLAERLLRSCEAAHEVGGDARGMQGAQLKVYREGAGFRGTDLLVDLRVDDSPNAIADLRQLWEDWRFHHLYGVGFQPIEQTAGNDVRELQRHLLTLGYVEAGDPEIFGPDGTPRGIFNDATAAAAVRWKRDADLDDGPYLVQFMLREIARRAGATGGEG